VTAPIWIRESDIRVTLGEAIELLRSAMTRQARGQARNMDKTHAQWPGGNMHAIGAVFMDTAVLGVKAWAHTPKGATPLELVWDAETGKLLAVIEAFAMGQLRTAGIAGLATDCLAEVGADCMTVCGTGKQAMAQVAAVKSVRPLKTVRIYGRDPAKRASLAARVQRELSLRTEEFSDVREAVRGAPVVTLITRASEPFLAADCPTRGSHINAMGAITPERKEFEPALVDRCAVVAVDSIDQARTLSSELMSTWSGDLPRPALRELSALVDANAKRPAGADLTLFKSLGVGISDLALAEEIYRRARERNVGVALPEPAPVPLTFSTSEGQPG
jgi:ornithine cyclodeaminase